MQPGWGHRWFLVLSLLTVLTLAPVPGGGVASLRGVAEGGDWGRGTLSCLTRVRSVRIRAIMNREGLGGVAGAGGLRGVTASFTDKSRGADN